MIGYGLGIGYDPDNPSSAHVEILKSQRPAYGAEEAWARWQDRHINLDVLLAGPVSPVPGDEGSSYGTSTL